MTEHPSKWSFSRITGRNKKQSEKSKNIHHLNLKTEFNKPKYDAERLETLENSDELLSYMGESSAEVNILLSTFSAAAIAVSPPIGIAVMSVSLLVLKLIQIYNKNNELTDILEEILEILTFISNEFDLSDKGLEGYHYMKRLKEHIMKIWSLSLTVFRIQEWRMVIFPQSLITRFSQELTFTNTSLIMILKTVKTRTRVIGPLTSARSSPRTPTKGSPKEKQLLEEIKDIGIETSRDAIIGLTDDLKQDILEALANSGNKETIEANHNNNKILLDEPLKSRQDMLLTEHRSQVISGSKKMVELPRKQSAGKRKSKRTRKSMKKMSPYNLKLI